MKLIIVLLRRNFVYLDKINVFVKIREEHDEDLKVCLTQLSKCNLTFNDSKRVCNSDKPIRNFFNRKSFSCSTTHPRS